MTQTPGKFGTFGGVFTPSILTILGVIMYLRLPWIVGQAGLYATIGIILVAHIISFTTGLSVASISTDKKVRVGGNYYIISRSMGLSIGGTLGIALFIGLSFSISLYVIGFVESFLPFWGIEPTREAIRLYGTVAVLGVTGIILISTSLALRVQYFILGAIVLSLVSVAFGGSEYIPATPLLERPDGGLSLITLFGIFFPAVTGFTTGVQMSGDLRDPRKSLPTGTIVAIVTGFLVYIALTFLFAYRIDAGALTDNRNILVEVSLFPPILFAGIWGATLSSAMGSLLGAPRILQATSIDRITPRIFARGYGVSNEPRNALVLSFVIAEAGILIAELDLIAALISIFFITTYGFINLSCAIENWASTDFRPSFRIPTWVSVIGTVACFLVMIQLDLPAFLGASLVLVLLYLFLKKKELTLESGDTWEGVWSSVIRSGLHELSRRRTAERNWRPNIILFSGGAGARPHLVEFGQWLVDKRGLLSNFDLIEKPDSSHLFTRPQQLVADGEDTPQGIFHKRLICRNFYEGMETITQVYGFSGVDPNTVMMGWARQTRDPAHFTGVIRHCRDMDYNILLMDYDRARGFGARQLIDIWWADDSNNAALALTIIKFLKLSTAWQDAECRILIVIDDSTLENRVYRNMNELLDAQRIDATVKVINNAIEIRNPDEIIQVESRESDLVILSISALSLDQTDRFIARTNTLVDNLGTTLILYASSYFKPLSIGVEDTSAEKLRLKTGTQVGIKDLPPLPTPHEASNGSHIAVFNSIMRSYAGIERYIEEKVTTDLKAVQDIQLRWLEDIRRTVDRSFQTLGRRLPDMPKQRAYRLIAGVQSDSLFQLRRLLLQYQETHLPAQEAQWTDTLDRFLLRMESIIAEASEESPVIFDPNALAGDPEDTLLIRLYKWQKRLQTLITKKPVTIHIQTRVLLQYHMQQHLYLTLAEEFAATGLNTYQLMSDVQKWSAAIYDAVGMIDRLVREDTFSPEQLEQEHTKLNQRLEEIADVGTKGIQGFERALLHAGRRMIQEMTEDIARPDVNRRTARNRRQQIESVVRDDFLRRPALWARNQNLMAAFAMMDVSVMVFRHRLRTIADKITKDCNRTCEERVLAPLAQLEKELQGMATDPENETAGPSLPARSQVAFDDKSLFDELYADIQSAVEDVPETIQIMSESTFQHLDRNQYADIDLNPVPLRLQIDYLVETEFLTPVKQELRVLAEAAQSTIDTAEEVMRLIQFHRHAAPSSDETEMSDIENSFSEIISDSIERIVDEKQKMTETVDRIRVTLDERLDAACALLNPYRLTRMAGHISQDIRSKESRRILSRILDRIRDVKKQVQAAIVRVLYRKSEGILLARKLREKAAAQDTRVESILSISESVSPSSEVMAELPFYYRQLFLGKHAVKNEFWLRKPAERQRAERAVNRYRQGYHGALLVTGDAQSGKSAYCLRVANTIFRQQKSYHIFAPDGGSADPDQFRQTLQATLQSAGDFDQIFQAVPSGSLLIFHDLELWWERSRDGFAVIDLLLDLIDRYSERCFFLVNMQTQSFRFINRVKPIEPVFLDMINCEPFDARDLQTAILLRHRSSGLTFELDGRQERYLSEFRLARLFTEYFDFSAGNIGMALHTWIGHIQGIKGDRIMIRTPERPDLNMLRQMDPEWLVHLQQFVLHKQLTRERLARIFYQDDDASVVCQTLKRTGLVIESAQGIFTLNPYMQPFIVQAISEAEMI